MQNPDDILFFLHIPKTAGTSLTKWMSSMFREAEICPHIDFGSLEAAGVETLRNYRFVAGHYGLEVLPHFPRRPKVTTWLREPSRRLLSNYRYLRDLPKDSEAILQDPSARSQMQAARTLTFHEWVDLPDDGYFIHNVMAQILAGKNAWGEYLVPAAVQRLDSFDHFGLVERMQDSVNLLSARLGWESRPFEIRLNQSAAASERAIDDATMDLIRQRSRRDYMLYEWARRRFEDRMLEQSLFVQREKRRK